MSRKFKNAWQPQRSSGWVFGWVLGLFALGMIPAGLLAPAAFATDADHLIIQQFLIKTRTPYTTFGSPFIKLTNPTASEIDMSHVYLTDATSAPSAVYYNITRTEPAVHNPGGGTGGDFHVRFPDGFSLGAGESVIISLNGSTQFFTAYARQPDFELFEDSSIPDAVPEMVPAFPGAVSAGPLGGANVPALSDVAESLMLYQWDRQSNLVQDLDYVLWGTNTAVRVDKTGVTVDGSTYLSDTAVGDQVATTTVPSFGHTQRRVSSDEGAENTSGGNGLTGHDETSENFAVTWADALGVDPGMGLVTAFPPAPIISDLANGDATDGSDITLMATVQSFGTMGNVLFNYRVDGGSFSLAMGANIGGSTWRGEIPDQAEGAVVEYYCLAYNAEGGSTTYPAGAPLFAPRSVTVGPAPEPGPLPEKLLITEVSTGPNIYPFTGMEQIAAEFVEFHNPNDYAVDLSDYYLTDAINYIFSTQLYWFITQGNPTQDTVGGGHYNDFTARFPDDFMIPAHGTITMSIGGSSWFEAMFGIAPDIELYEDGDVADDIPDMRPVFVNPGDDLPGDSIFTADRPTTSGDALPKGIPELEEFYGEPLILYHYIEGEDKVTDIDIFMWGDAKTGNYRYGFQKIGPTYAEDTPVEEQIWYMPLDQSGVLSYSRVDSDETGQTASGGNGVDGRDETSEDLDANFQLMELSPGTYPNPVQNVEIVEPVTGLVARWPFDGSFQDVSGSGHDGAGNFVTWGEGVSGAPGTAAVFSRDLGSYINVPHSSDFDFGTGEFAVSFWAWHSASADLSNFSYVSKYVYDNETTSGFHVSTGLISIGGPVYRQFTSGWWETCVVRSSQTNIEDGLWYHVLSQRVGPNLEIWVNGILENRIENIGCGPNIDNPADLIIGAYANLAGSLNGKIDDLRIFNRQLTTGEIYYLSRAESPMSEVGELTDGMFFPGLLQNHPNPFNPLTTITFEISRQTTVNLRVFDLSGRLVRVLLGDEVIAPGRHETVWDGRDKGGRKVASGTYFYRLEAGGVSETKRMTLLK